MRYALDPWARRLDGGRVLIGGSPLTVFRLGPAGRRAVDALERGEEPAASAQPLLERLVARGAAHPRPDEPGRPDEVTAVIPVRDHDPRPTIAALGTVGAVVVVDDATATPRPPPAGVEWVRRDRNGGPAVARMDGAARARTPLIAFVDADCTPAPGWLAPLLPHFTDPAVAMVAPRVISEPGRRELLARYEELRSPLDMGPVEAAVARGSRISYVPAAAVVVRATALADVGGFDPSLRRGEDVDLTWRLLAAGWTVRYDPRSVVSHRPRPTVATWAVQRVGYGRSAADLDARHPGALAPVAVGVTAGLVPAARLAHGLRGVPGRRREAVRHVGWGLLATADQLAGALTRVWWPIATLGALTSRRVRGVLLVALVVPAARAWMRRRGRIDLPRYVVLRALDDAAYGLGVWAGVLRHGRIGPLLPRVRAQPPPARPSRSANDRGPITVKDADALVMPT